MNKEFLKAVAAWAVFLGILITASIAGMVWSNNEINEQRDAQFVKDRDAVKDVLNSFLNNTEFTVLDIKFEGGTYGSIDYIPQSAHIERCQGNNSFHCTITLWSEGDYSGWTVNIAREFYGTAEEVRIELPFGG